MAAYVDTVHTKCKQYPQYDGRKLVSVSWARLGACAIIAHNLFHSKFLGFLPTSIVIKVVAYKRDQMGYRVGWWGISLKEIYCIYTQCIMPYNAVQYMVAMAVMQHAIY